jgi:hypothetical protein
MFHLAHLQCLPGHEKYSRRHSGLSRIGSCPELEYTEASGSLMQIKQGLTQKDGKKFATGITECCGHGLEPVDENLIVVMHGRDDLHLLWPEKFSPWQSAVLPSEEFQQVKEGDDFGWPLLLL